WSVMTALCGLSSTYSQLLLARVGVGAGEASLTPSAWSLMADYFPPDKLARPLSVFLMGPYLGGGLALIFGGQIIGWLGADSTVDVPVFGALQAWQVVFLSVGLPGLLLALVLATIKEPARKAAKKDERTDRSANMREIWAHISGNWPLYISIYVGISFLVVILYGLQAWVPTLLIRAYGWDVATAGKLYGTVALVFGSLGVLSGPAISRALARRGAANPELQLALFASVLAVLFGVAGPLMPTPALALLFIAAASYAVSSPLALVASVLQTRTPNRMRGGVAGLYVLAVNVIGLGVGPTLVALITDGVFGDPSKVGWSLSVLCGIAGTAAAATIATALRKDKQS
ncbi:MAG: MFS transporter, partial [Caulobacterales bacterium]|nr:MFS transporter [Caulobacterales bacterium]